MIDFPRQPVIKRLSPMNCGRCGWPVGHLNKTVAGAEAGGLCTRCTKDQKTGKDLMVFTVYVVIKAGDDT